MTKPASDRRRVATCRHCGDQIRRETTRSPWGHVTVHLDTHHTPEPFPKAQPDGCLSNSVLVL